MAALDRRGGEQRSFHPRAQKPAAHGGFGLVQHPEKAAALFAAAQRFRQLKASSGGPVKLHIPPAVKHVEPVNVAEVELLRLLDIRKQRARRAHGGGRVPDAGVVNIPEAKALAHSRGGGHELKFAAPVLKHRAELLRQKLGDGTLPLSSR